MSKENIFFSADYVNQDFTGLFDRIINIKFTRKSGKSFTLRSDYEPIWEGGRLYFKTCQPKPEIRIQYTQYQATMINIDIYVTNLNIMERAALNSEDAMLRAGIDAVTTNMKQGKDTNQPNDVLTRLGDTISKVEFEMGYRGQFDSIYNWAQHEVPRGKEQEYYDAFQNLEVPGSDVDTKKLHESQAFFNYKELRRCHAVIEWATNISNPPDRITQFHGYVGSTDAGFQPFALLTLDCDSEAGATGQITRQDVIDGLDDEYYTIEEVATKDYKTSDGVQVEGIKDEQGGTPFNLLVSSKNVSYRNFFNGGKGFTLLEGYCFHMVTRRFIRSNVEVKRNQLLEQAALEFSLASVYTGASVSIKGLKDKLEQEVYKREKGYFPEYFKWTEAKPGEGKFSIVEAKMPAPFKKYLEESINAMLVEQYIGSRFTIKGLPEYRKLYLSIRQIMTDAVRAGQYITWWDAAEQLNNDSKFADEMFSKINPEFSFTTREGKRLKREKVLVERDIKEVRKYILELENVATDENNNPKSSAFKDYYFSNTEWILPVQNIKTSVKLKNGKGIGISFKPPTKTNDSGFTTLGKDTPMKCFTGLFEVRDAYMFGVPVLCSQRASEIFEKAHAAKDASINTQFMSQPQGQIEWICKTWGFQYYKMHNGGYFIYVKGESSREIASESFIVTQSSKPFRIPAIYDMTISPIRRIRMPFIAFLNPMTIVEWNSTAMIGSMISYYYQPDKGRNFFLTIKNSIDFSTVGEYNTMEIDLVDTQWSEKPLIPVALTNQEISLAKANVFTEVIIFVDSQMNTWRKIYESPVGKIPYNMQAMWVPTDNPDSFLSEDRRVSNEQFFNLLQKWNQTLFDSAKGADSGWAWDDSKSRVDKQANKSFGGSRPANTNFPAIEYCMNELADPKLKRIYMKFPFMPNEADYDSAYMKPYDSKFVLVYKQGTWTMYPKTELRNEVIIGEI